MFCIFLYIEVYRTYFISFEFGFVLREARTTVTNTLFQLW